MQYHYYAPRLHVLVARQQRIQRGVAGVATPPPPINQFAISPYKWLSDCTKIDLDECEIQKFPGGACPQTPLHHPATLTFAHNILTTYCNIIDTYMSAIPIVLNKAGVDFKFNFNPTINKIYFQICPCMAQFVNSHEISTSLVRDLHVGH